MLRLIKIGIVTAALFAGVWWEVNYHLLRDWLVLYKPKTDAREVVKDELQYTAGTVLTKGVGAAVRDFNKNGNTAMLDQGVGEARVVSDHIQNLADGKFTPQPCGGGQKRDPNANPIILDLRPCNTNAVIQMQFNNNDVGRAVTWQAKLYRYRKDGKRVASGEEPVIKVRQDEPDGFSYVKPLGNGLFECKGFYKFVHEDASDELELTRQ